MGSLLELVPALHQFAPGQQFQPQRTAAKLLPQLFQVDNSQHKSRASSSNGTSTSGKGLDELQPVGCDSLADAITRGLTGAKTTLINSLRPNGPGVVETHSKWLNVISSLPYIALGWGIVRQCSAPESKAYGYSVMGVGANAMAFHLTDGTDGAARLWSRRLDYWCIAASTAAMVRAVFPQAPARATTASLAATPFQPFTVSATNIAAMEVEYMRRAQRNPSLRHAHRLHVSACTLGTLAFFLEDLVPHVPGVHGAWHCLSAVGLATTTALLRDVERTKAAGGSGSASSTGFKVV